MKTRVIPNGVRDLTQGGGSRLFQSVIQAAWARSFAPLRMTAHMAGRYTKTLIAFSFLSACVVSAWLALPKPPLLGGISFSQCVRARNGKLLRVTLTADQKVRMRTRTRDMSPAWIGGTMRFEDKYY